MKYIPLNVKTEYDLMNSLIKIDELILYAQKFNISSVGITDENMFGTMEFINKCKDNQIKPIIGIEVFIDDINFLLYAKNYNGYISLCEIVTIKNIENLSFDRIKNYNDIICVCNYKNYLKLKEYFDEIYIGYRDKNEKNESIKLSKSIVYIPCIRYFNVEDKEYFKYIRLIEEGKTVDDEVNVSDEYIKDNYDEFDIKTTIEFSKLIDIKLPKREVHIPKYKENSTEFLRALSKKGLDKRLNGNIPPIYKNRLMYELSVIEKMNFVDYFLIVYDFVLFAKKSGIRVGPGRGSGAASLVNYSLGIINIDPLKYDLIFERFLNPDRVTMPDIDIDFDNMRREEVIDYVSNKYGKYNTARIISFNTMLPKQIIRDTARVMNIDIRVVDNICKTIKDEKTFDELKNNKDFINVINRSTIVKKLINICNRLCGLKKNTAMHAAGVVISDEKLTNIMPLYKNNDVILTCYSMEYIESLGLLKMDFLSIKNLNTISNILNDIGGNIDIDNIPLDDTKTLNLFKNAYTSGIFQFESNGMRSFLKSLEVDSFNTLVDAIALYRPGPRDNIDEYIKRKKGIKKVDYLVKELEPILKSTYGIIIYQEQVLEILRTIGGFSYSQADNIRRAMSKKKYALILKEKDKIINGVINKGYDKNVATKLYDLIVKFSSYGFNKSHSVVYSKVAYQMAYLKSHYTKYFMKNLLNMNKGSEKLKEYMDEAKILGLLFSKVDINKSGKEFIIEDNNLVIPFTIINSIAFSVSDEIINERNKGLFKSFYDFMIRCYGKSINKRVVVSLIECGAFDKFNINKKNYIDNIDEVLNYVSLCKDLNMVLDSEPVFESTSDYSDKELIELEIKNYGFYLSHHPITKYDRASYITLENYKKYFNRVITCLLYVESIKNIKTKNNDKMAFIKFSDEYATVEGVLFPSAYSKIGDVSRNNIYKVNAKVERRENTYQLIIYNMIRID